MMMMKMGDTVGRLDNSGADFQSAVRSMPYGRRIDCAGLSSSSENPPHCFLRMFEEYLFEI
jgi:hypothetical protein